MNSGRKPQVLKLSLAVSW